MQVFRNGELTKLLQNIAETWRQTDVRQKRKKGRFGFLGVLGSS